MRQTIPRSEWWKGRQCWFCTSAVAAPLGLTELTTPRISSPFPFTAPQILPTLWTMVTNSIVHFTSSNHKYITFHVNTFFKIHSSFNYIRKRTKAKEEEKNPNNEIHLLQNSVKNYSLGGFMIVVPTSHYCSLPKELQKLVKAGFRNNLCFVIKITQKKS